MSTLSLESVDSGDPVRFRRARDGVQVLRGRSSVAFVTHDQAREVALWIGETDPRRARQRRTRSVGRLQAERLIVPREAAAGYRWRFTADGIAPPSLNARLEVRNGQKVRSAAATKFQTDVATFATLELRRQGLQGPLTVPVLVFAEIRGVNLDPDNASKDLLDGLEGVAWRNDRQLAMAPAVIVRPDMPRGVYVWFCRADQVDGWIGEIRAALHRANGGVDG